MTVSANKGILAELNLKHGILLSVAPVAEEKYLQRNSPLLLTVRREGVPA